MQQKEIWPQSLLAHIHLYENGVKGWEIPILGGYWEFNAWEFKPWEFNAQQINGTLMPWESVLSQRCAVQTSSATEVWTGFQLPFLQSAEQLCSNCMCLCNSPEPLTQQTYYLKLISCWQTLCVKTCLTQLEIGNNKPLINSHNGYSMTTDFYHHKEMTYWISIPT